MCVRRLATLMFVVGAPATMAAGDSASTKLKTATIQWVADTPQLTYDVRFTGGDSTTMPTALKSLLKDIADSEGISLTGESKTKTIASQIKRISLEYTPAKSKQKGMRINKIDIKETGDGVECLVTFGKKPGKDDLTRIDGVLETFARKYKKTAKGVAATVRHAESLTANGWIFTVRFKDKNAPDKDKK